MKLQVGRRSLASSKDKMRVFYKCYEDGVPTIRTKLVANNLKGRPTVLNKVSKSLRNITIDKEPCCVVYDEDKKETAVYSLKTGREYMSLDQRLFGASIRVKK